MGKLKKHQLLEKAMRDYPKGTIARFESAPHVDHVSDGIFQILDINNDGTTGVFSGRGLSCFYVSHDEDGTFVDQWAKAVKPSILDGKVAIQVNNEREFKLLMEHYEGKGWIDRDWISKNGMLSTTEYWTYNEECYRPKLSEVIKTGYKIIHFSDFAAEVGITVPKFIMKSEDGVDLYEGDDCHWSINDAHDAGGHEWRYLYGTNINEGHLNLSDKGFIAFSTKEAAEAWIAEQNKPALISLFGEGDDAEVIVRSDGSISVDKIKIHQGYIGITFPKGDVEQIIEAYKSLNGKEVSND